MRKFFQTEWHGINFADIATLSTTRLAGEEFYAAFYRELFRRYASPEALPQPWLKEKLRCAQFVREQAGNCGKILAVGCGLGVIERLLIGEESGPVLHVHEVTDAAWPWLAPMIPDERKHIGRLPECLPAGHKFDLIYLSAVDYAMATPELVAMLAALRDRLNKGGRCLMISASLLDEGSGGVGRLKAALRQSKASLLEILERLRVHSRGQFWGWLRSAQEYRGIMAAAGYQDLTEGFIHPSNRQHFWICGQVSKCLPR